jgi:hypothetical protein
MNPTIQDVVRRAKLRPSSNHGRRSVLFWSRGGGDVQASGAEVAGGSASLFLEISKIENGSTDSPVIIRRYVHEVSIVKCQKSLRGSSRQ